MNIMKVVITGSPCSGKSTLIAELKMMGFPVIEEIARSVLEKVGAPLTLEDKEKLQIKIARQQKEIESKTRYSDILFLDRGLIDVIAYCNILLGYIPQEVLDITNVKSYNAVFILEKIPFLQDGLRLEKSDKEAENIHNELISTYNINGYSPIFVPIMPLDKRIEFIFSHIKNLKGGNIKNVCI